MPRRGGGARRRGVAHAHPAHVALAAETRALPPTKDWLAHAGPMIHALRSGRSIFLPHATPAEIEGFTGGVEEDLRLFRTLPPHPGLAGPPLRRGRPPRPGVWVRLGRPRGPGGRRG